MEMVCDDGMVTETWFKGWDSFSVVYGSLVNRKAKKRTKGFEIFCVKLECAMFCACVQVLNFLEFWECSKAANLLFYPLSSFFYFANTSSIYREEV